MYPKYIGWYNSRTNSTIVEQGVSLFFESHSPARNYANTQLGGNNCESTENRI